MNQNLFLYIMSDSDLQSGSKLSDHLKSIKAVCLKLLNSEFQSQRYELFPQPIWARQALISFFESVRLWFGFSF